MNKKNYLNWVQIAKKELKNIKLDSLYSKTPDGIEIKPIYTVDDLKNLEHVFSYPGIGPYLRGPKATMYPNRPWTVRQYSGFSTAEESNVFYKTNITFEFADGENTETLVCFQPDCPAQSLLVGCSRNCLKLRIQVK